MWSKISTKSNRSNEAIGLVVSFKNTAPHVLAHSYIDNSLLVREARNIFTFDDSLQVFRLSICLRMKGERVLKSYAQLLREMLLGLRCEL